jgi:hypothetical protein
MFVGDFVIGAARFEHEYFSKWNRLTTSSSLVRLFFKRGSVKTRKNKLKNLQGEGNVISRHND